MAKNGRYYRYLRRRRRSRNGKGTPRWLMALAVLGGLFVIVFGVLFGVGYGVYQSYADDLEDLPPDKALAQLPSGGARIRDKNGILLFEYLNEEFGRREPVPLNEVSLYLVAATVAAEDASFWDNPGVNFKGLAAAAWDNFSPFGGAPGFLQGRGGSSITQQLVKNVYFPPEERAKRTVNRKLKETVYAMEITRKYSKAQILEWYLNLISYGNLYTGVEAASQGYFGKSARDLTLAEAATLAGIPSHPTRYDPINQPEAAKAQRNRVLIRMYEEGYIEPTALLRAGTEPLEAAPQRFPVKAPHFVFYVVEPQLERMFGKEAKLRDGLEVYTTLDLKWQQQAEAIVEERISAAEGYSGGHNGAFVAIEPNTAQILVYVGSRDFFDTEIEGKNDMAGALNSPGSAFKPITYLTTFVDLGWGPGTMILDTPITVRYRGGEPFTPANPSGNFQGPITVRFGLGNSLNVPAVKAMLYAGVPNVLGQAKKMGITSFDDQVLGPALTTGGGDLRLVNLTYAYTVFPNLGLLKGIETELDLPPGNRSLDPVSILRVEDRDGNVLYPLVDEEPVEAPVVQEERVAPAEETYLVTDILVDPNAECVTFGCNRLSIPDGRPLAVKTGTSAPYRYTRATGDTWTFAYTPQIVVGTWFGNADNSPLGGVSSTTLSWPIVQDFMTEFHRGLPVVPFTKPQDLEPASVCLLSGLKPAPEDSPSCPTTPEDLLPERTLPEKEDDWWTKARIDTRTGLLASDVTPPQYVGERLFLQLPDSLSAFERDQALEWATKLGAIVGSAPTEETREEDIPVAITSPANGTQVYGEVIITGRARSSKFVSYRLEYRSDADPGGWTLINSSDSPVTDGPLGTWDTSGLATSFYTIRLVLVDEELGEVGTWVRVALVAPEPTPTATPTPVATPAEEGRRRPSPGPRHRR